MAMPFTDEDLMVLKQNAHGLGANKTLALLARLEAAEKCICLFSRCDQCEPFIEKWKKAAGK